MVFEFILSEVSTVESRLDHEKPWGLGIISGDNEAGPEQFKVLPTLGTAHLSVSQVFPKSGQDHM